MNFLAVLLSGKKKGYFLLIVDSNHCLICSKNCPPRHSPCISLTVIFLTKYVLMSITDSLAEALGSWVTGFRDSPSPSPVSRSECARVSLRLADSNHALGKQAKKGCLAEGSFVGYKLLLGGQLVSSPVLHFAYTGLAHPPQ